MSSYPPQDEDHNPDQTADGAAQPPDQPPTDSPNPTDGQQPVYVSHGSNPLGVPVVPPVATGLHSPIESSGHLQQQDPNRRSFRGSKVAAALAWCVILGITTFIFSTTVWMQLKGPVDDGATTQGELMQINLQGKMLLGQQNIFNMQPDPFFEPEPDAENGEADNGKRDAQKRIKRKKPNVSKKDLNVLSALNIGPPESRYCYAILLNEFDGAESALDQLDATEELIERLNYEETEDQKRLREIIGSLFEQYEMGDYDSSNLSTEDQQFLKRQLGWSGELVLLPRNTPNVAARTSLENEARNSLFIMIGAFILGLLMFLAGLVAVAIFFVLVASAGILPRFIPQSTNGRIYVETFAIWMLGFVGLQIGLALVGSTLGIVSSMFLTAAMFFASLVVLVWPVVRGIPFSQVRKDIGWKFGNPFVESAIAVTSYVAMIPFMAFSLVFVVLIMGAITLVQSSSETNELSGAGPVGHPIQEQIAMGDPLIFLGVFLTACIAAPVVEETMFRGVLYRHLRDSTSRWARFGSVLMSAVVSGLIFAAIHPQGLFGIPILATLAFGFALVREWRDSLIAPMLMHAINNGMVTCLLFLIV